MARNNEQQSRFTIGNPIERRIPFKSNLDAFARSIDKIDEKHKEALEKKSAINLAISQLKLNKAEDKWKYEYAKKIQDKIDNAATFGDYSTALNTAIEMAGKAIGSPEVTGRIRANEEFEKVKSVVDARNDINQITKDRWNAQNKYNYTDEYDENGNIVGGSEWKANWTPTAKVDLKNLVAAAQQLTAPEKKTVSSSYENTQSLTNQGGIQGTNRYGKKEQERINTQINGTMVNGFATTNYQTRYRTSGGGKTFGYEKLDAAKIKETYEALQAIDPAAIASINQDYDDIAWKVSDLKIKIDDPNTSPEDKVKYQSEYNIYNQDFIDPETKMPYGDKKAWVLSKLGVVINNMAYYNTTTATESKRGVSDTFGSNGTNGFEKQVGGMDDGLNNGNNYTGDAYGTKSDKNNGNSQNNVDVDAAGRALGLW